MTTEIHRHDAVRSDDDTIHHPAVRDEESSYDERSFASDEHTHHPEEASQRERFGGLNWGAGFFGWLVTVAVTALLLGVAGAAAVLLGTAAGVLTSATEGGTVTFGISVLAVVLGVLVVAHYAGGYVAGRMSRFDGARQGIGVWATGLILSGAVVALALLLAPQIGTVELLDLPTLRLAAGVPAVGVAVAAALGTLLAAVAGGVVGCRYHRKVDHAAVA